ncbi:hypothetical protein Q650_00604 [Bartonella quintana JK 73rel]|nr:hypothetical protein Q650_00604 [Bartonella quintana JK 73rel]
MVRSHLLRTAVLPGRSMTSVANQGLTVYGGRISLSDRLRTENFTHGFIEDVHFILKRRFEGKNLSLPLKIKVEPSSLRVMKSGIRKESSQLVLATLFKNYRL